MEGSPPKRVVGEGSEIERIPVECISLVLSSTSPRDVCRSSAVSKAFLSAAKSDIAWDPFLPPDLEEILLRSSSPVASSSKRDLYFRLCDPMIPIPIDDGSKVLWLEKATGRKCYMLAAEAVGINNALMRISEPTERFPEAAEEMPYVCWLEIRASINSRDLSPDTGYGAYLVMRLSDSSYGLAEPPQETEIFVGTYASTRSVRLQVRRAGQAEQPAEEGRREEGVCVPRDRGDGWMELEMGDFFVQAGGEELVKVKLKGWLESGHTIQGLPLKSGLIVRGIELRPI